MELTVISGKGGTGKTTISVALSQLQKESITIDCDVDSPNLYLFYGGTDIEHGDFYGNKIVAVDENLCNHCKKCEKVCRFEAIHAGKVTPFKCEGCGACVLVCPQKAITLKDEKSADTFITKAPKGIISRAKMEIGSDCSGKLITQIRKNAKKYQRPDILTVIDGSPGVGCSVISSIAGSDMVLIVTEPTQSGFDDFKRTVELCKHFGIMTFACINKADINAGISKQIEQFCVENEIKLVGKIPFDDCVMKSINELTPIIYYEESVANKAIRQMWNQINKNLSLK